MMTEALVVVGLVSTMVTPLDGQWLLATDPRNVGRDEKWYAAPRPDAKLTKVPWLIQDAFPGYHGVAWYWRNFDAPRNPHAQGRYLLRFWAVDYKADVWLNGKHIGEHEGGETPFVLDATDAIKPGKTNRIAVRVQCNWDVWGANGIYERMFLYAKKPGAPTPAAKEPK